MARKRLTDEEILAQIPAARARGARSLRTEPHAAAARYDAATRSLAVTLTSGAGVIVPVALVPWLADATDAQLAAVDVSPQGVGLHWPALDADMTVAGLVRYVFGRRTLARAVGAAGGATRSEAKAEAARANGAKGGRPRKIAANGGALLARGTNAGRVKDNAPPARAGLLQKATQDRAVTRAGASTRTKGAKAKR